MDLPKNFKLSIQQKKAFELVNNTKKSCFIYGAAGSGKTSFIEYFRKNSNKKTITLTPTGLAAVLIRGQTIHSFFQLPNRLLLKNDKQVKIISKRKRQLKLLDVLIIDEISTVRCDILNAVDDLLQKYRKNNEPFGGVQMLFVGDFFQIAPVEPKGENEWEAFKNDYKSIWFFDSDGYKDLDPELILFSHIHRQKDKQLKDYLETIRRNQYSDQTLNYFNNRRINNEMNPPSSAIALCPTNRRVNEYNEDYLDRLSGEPYTYIGESKNFRPNEFPTDLELVLKEKSRVMMLKNDPAGRWVNGTFAIITSLSENEIHVTVPKNGKYSKEYSVDIEIWEKFDFRLNKNNEFEPHVVGTFKQYPIRIARATTIHKSQGQTFDNVLVDFDSGAFTHGQAYVALSRTRTYEGLFLKKKLKRSDIRFDQKVVNYFNKHFQASLFDNLPTEFIEEEVPFQ